MPVEVDAVYAFRKLSWYADPVWYTPLDRNNSLASFLELPKFYSLSFTSVLSPLARLKWIKPEMICEARESRRPGGITKVKIGKEVRRILFDKFIVYIDCSKQFEKHITDIFNVLNKKLKHTIHVIRQWTRSISTQWLPGVKSAPSLVKDRVPVPWHLQLTITLFDYRIVALNPSNSANWLGTPTLLPTSGLSRADCLRRRDALSAFWITRSLETHLPGISPTELCKLAHWEYLQAERNLQNYVNIVTAYLKDLKSHVSDLTRCNLIAKCYLF